VHAQAAIEMTGEMSGLAGQMLARGMTLAPPSASCADIPAGPMPKARDTEDCDAAGSFGLDGDGLAADLIPAKGDGPHLRRLRFAQKASAISFAALAEYRDVATADHLHRVARLTSEIARHLAHAGPYQDQISGDFLEHIGVAGALHDVGKISVPDSVLLKPGRLDDSEMAVMRQHSQWGAELLERARHLWLNGEYLDLGIEIARSHHERFDGSGYPDGLSRRDIPLSARIVAVADVYDALTHPRCYKDAWTETDARNHIREHSGQLYDPEIASSLETVLERRDQYATIAWSDSLAIGIPEIDNDHLRLVGLINQMICRDEVASLIQVEDVVEELAAYALAHFGREKRVMERLGLSKFQEHLAAHDWFLTEVHSLRDRLLDDSPELVGDAVVGFLFTWLSDHILGSDRYLVETAAPWRIV